MKRNVIAFTMLTAVVTAGTVYAIQQDIEVSARMRIGLSFANVTDMDFTPSSGHIDFYGPVAATDVVTMGTDGAVAANTAVFEPSANTGTPGSVDINGDATSDVYITCTATATMAETGGKTLTVDNLQLAIDTGVAYNDAAAYACSGLNSVTPKSHTLDGTDTIIMGGRLVGKSDVVTGLYSTATSGGTAATIQVIYQ